MALLPARPKPLGTQRHPGMFDHFQDAFVIPQIAGTGLHITSGMLSDSPRTTTLSERVHIDYPRST